MPYLGSFATAVPRNPDVRYEILKAAETLAGGDRAARQRRAEIASIRNELEAIREEAVGLYRHARSLIFSELRKYGYNPDEPRVPKHHAGGGRWTKDGTQFAAADTDDAASILQPRGGHHFVPRAVYEKLPLKPETRKVFDNARTGSLQAGLHGWSPEHKLYNRVVAEALRNFLEKNGLQPDAEDMTPEQAQQFVFEVIGSSDSRIRDFNLRFIGAKFGTI